MKEITIRLYHSGDENIRNALEKDEKYSYFELVVDGKVYTGMKRIALDVRYTDEPESGQWKLDRAVADLTVEQCIDPISWQSP